MVKVWFPSMYMRLVSLKTTVTPPIAKLQVPKSMTKTEIKEYLTKIYNVDVVKVDTANYLGLWKRLYGKRRVISFKRRDIKMAYVTYSGDKTPTPA